MKRFHDAMPCDSFDIPDDRPKLYSSSWKLSFICVRRLFAELLIKCTSPRCTFAIKYVFRCICTYCQMYLYILSNTSCKMYLSILSNILHHDMFAFHTHWQSISDISYIPTASKQILVIVLIVLLIIFLNFNRFAKR